MSGDITMGYLSRLLKTGETGCFGDGMRATKHRELFIPTTTCSEFKQSIMDYLLVEEK